MTDDSVDSVSVDDLLDRIATHDEDLATDASRILEEHDRQLAAEEDQIEEYKRQLEEAEEQIAALEDEVEDLEGRLKRKQADFENYKKRQQREQERIREQATEKLIERLLDVRDNLDRALEEGDDVESLRDGLRMTAQEFDRVLDAEGVTTISPEPGTEVDPTRHEVVFRTEADAPEGTVAELYRPGYAMNDSILRAAQVSVSAGQPESEASADPESTPE
ncbi:MAG: nucleotide exchange factor GrpE [Salinarchaeum sp.]